MGFIQDGQEFLACGTSYHTSCIVVGKPFRTQLANLRGLSYPAVYWLPNFICECCTVRAMLGRELITGSHARTNEDGRSDERLGAEGFAGL